MDFKKKSHVHDNNKFLYIINENKILIWLQICLMEYRQKDIRDSFFRSLSKLFALLFRTKRLLSNLRIPLKNECRRICNRNTEATQHSGHIPL